MSAACRSAYWEMLADAGITDLYAMGGGARSFMSGRVSFAFDLRGPSVSVDSACSSGLSALHLAYQSVRSGENALAVAGAVNLVTSPAETIPFSQSKMLAPDGRCKFGSADADGFVRSEGVAVVVLKPLAQAEADGDAIHAVIYGSAMGNDGQSEEYLMTPSQLGQEETLRAAYADAGVPPSQVDYVEAHGTGTPAGDPVELGALDAVIGADRAEQAPFLVGSVKSNIGHTEAVAGLAGFIKVVLALRHRRIPPNLHAAELTDKVDWDALRLRLVRETTEWPQADRPGLAGVSSFGISGTNAHIVVGEYQAPEPAEPSGDVTPEAELLVLSAPDPNGLTALATRYAEFLETDGDLSLRDVCFSAATRRQHHESRLTAAGASPGELAERLRAYAAGESRPLLGSTDYAPADATRPRTVFVFPGQGSQWDGMGRELLAGSPVFRDVLTRCDEVIRAEAGLVADRPADRRGRHSGLDRHGPADAVGDGDRAVRAAAGLGRRARPCGGAQHGRGRRGVRRRRAQHRGRGRGHLPSQPAAEERGRAGRDVLGGAVRRRRGGGAGRPRAPGVRGGEQQPHVDRHLR